MAKILIVYYSRSGNTRKMAQFIEEGAKSEGADTRLKEVSSVNAQELPDYDAVIVGSPTYFGTMAAEIKKMFDESIAVYGSLDGKVGAAFSSSANTGGGNETTITDILNALLIHGFVIQGTTQGDHYGPVSIGAPDKRVEKQCKDLGKRVTQLAEKLK